MRNSNAIFSHPRQLGSDYPLSARDGPSHSRRFNCALQLSSLFILCYLHACSRAFVWYRTAHVWGNFSKNLWFLGTFTPKVTFAFRVQILAICSKDYFWTFGELRLSQIAPPPSPPAALQPNGQTSFIGFASIFLAKEGGRSSISCCWRNGGRRGLEAGAGSWSAWRTKSSKFEILLRLKSLSFLSKVLVWLFV